MFASKNLCHDGYSLLITTLSQQWLVCRRLNEVSVENKSSSSSVCDNHQSKIPGEWSTMTKTLKVILQDIYWMFIFYCNLDISKDLQKIKHQENMQKELAANLTISSWLIYYFSVIVLILKWNNNMKWDVKRK